MPRTDDCADLDEYFDNQMCAAARARFRRHLGECQACQDGLAYRAALGAVLEQMRRPRLAQRVAELARTVRDVAPVVVAYAALAVVVALQGGGPGGASAGPGGRCAGEPRPALHHRRRAPPQGSRRNQVNRRH